MRFLRGQWTYWNSWEGNMGAQKWFQTSSLWRKHFNKTFLVTLITAFLRIGFKPRICNHKNPILGNQWCLGSPWPQCLWFFGCILFCVHLSFCNFVSRQRIQSGCYQSQSQLFCSRKYQKIFQNPMKVWLILC